MKKALQDIKHQIKEMMHQSESLPEIKALLRLSDEIDNVLEILPESNRAAAPKPAASRSKPVARSGVSRATSAKPAGNSNASAEAAPATAKMPAAPGGKSKKKEPFIDPGDR